MKEKLYQVIRLLVLPPMFTLVLFPASQNYQLRSYEFGAGGGTGASENYTQEAVLGEQTSNDQASENYKIGSGLNFVQEGDVPTVTLSNDASWYNKLKFIIGPQNNPTDATYAIAISTDDFATTQYVQNDNSVGSTLGAEDYQTYTNWGGATGENVIGLTPGTTYKVKVKAKTGQFTESPYGPTSSAATSNSMLDFDIDVSATDQETAAPYSLSLGGLNAGSVVTAGNKVWVDFDTNAEGGGYVYLYGQYGGLRSANLNYTISSSTSDLSSVNEGYGAQSSSATATSGTLVASSPYNNSSENVGVVDTTIRELYSSGNGPIVGGRGSVQIKAKVSTVTPASNDYTDTLTLVASGTF